LNLLHFAHTWYLECGYFPTVSLLMRCKKTSADESRRTRRAFEAQ
jgi:hypothetical protein